MTLCPGSPDPPALLKSPARRVIKSEPGTGEVLLVPGTTCASSALMVPVLTGALVSVHARQQKGCECFSWMYSYLPPREKSKALEGGQIKAACWSMLQ